ncbi:pitrilysin family protein [Caulobacter sp. 17J65-9]|uniref:M16 family metallopeptidase n=1 Tax=Caulobacter sp. 17J65-9 TaxID=2709382 RepID=UPI0032048868
MSARLHRLSNGVRVLCDPMPELETIAVSVVVRGGARWETPAQSGWSHLLEHMVFKGAGKRSAREIVEHIEAEGGNLNAATGYERTSYQVRALRDGLPLALEVVSDLLFRPTLAEIELEREKSVIDQEIAEAFDTPDDWVFELAQARAFADQPLGRPILGSTESVAAAGRAALDAFRRSLYAPERIVVSVAGAVEEGELLRQAERWFGDVDAGVHAPEPEPGRFVGGTATLGRRIEQANCVWQLPAAGARDDSYYALRLFAEILGGGMASRLFQSAREERGLAYSIDAYADSYEDTGVLGVYAGCAADRAAELSHLVAAQVKGLAEAPKAAELTRAKAQLKASLFMAQESPLARAERAAGQTFLFDRPLTVAEIRAGVDETSLDDLKRVGERALSPARAAVAVLGPRAAFGAAKAFAPALFL